MKLSEIAKILEVEMVGDDKEISGMNTLMHANEEEISFFHNAKYLKELPLTKAGAVILDKEFIKHLPSNATALISI